MLIGGKLCGVEVCGAEVCDVDGDVGCCEGQVIKDHLYTWRPTISK